MSDRLNRARATLSMIQADGLLVWKPANVRYLSGFTGSEGRLLITADQALFITDSRYTEQAGIQVVPNGFTVVTIRERFKEIGAKVKELGLASLAIEDESMTVAELGHLEKNAAGVAMQKAGNAVDALRYCKDEDEIAALRVAIKVQEEAMEAILPMIVPGAVENDISFNLEMEMRKRGASAVSFDTIVGSGPRGALPHGVASDKKVEAGELVVLDWGCIVNGYCSDQTLTVSVGEPSDPDAKKVFEIVRRAQADCIAAIKPGMKMIDIDKVARDVITEAGYGNLFGHGTGHSIGLEIHEEPRASMLCDATAEVGMVFTVEPGIYLPGRFGVRLEDIIVVTPTGAERLTTMSKNWRSTV